MKRSNKLLAYVLALLMVLQSVPFTAFAAGTGTADLAHTGAGFALSTDGGVIAKFTDASETVLEISGAGQIEQDKWVELAQKFNSKSFTFSENFNIGWSGTEDFDISFKNKNGKIMLCNSIESSDPNLFGWFKYIGLFENFDKQIYFNDAVDTSNVTNMFRMFLEATSFNQPVNFNTSKVTNMRAMFRGAKNFNQPLNFDTSNVKDMGHMFYNAKNFNQPLNFDTSNVGNMSYMFARTGKFNQPLTFDTSKVTDMSGMFARTQIFNQPLKFDTSEVKSMIAMFQGASSFNQPLNFNTSKVTNMGDMFSFTDSFNQPLNFNTSQVLGMGNMFSRARVFNQPLNFDTSKVIDMKFMFMEADKFNQPLNFDTSEVTSMVGMFFGASSFNQPLDFDTSKVTNMENMFKYASSFNQDISAWDTSNVKNMVGMFEAATAMKSIDLRNRTNAKDTGADEIFSFTSADSYKFKGFKTFAWAFEGNSGNYKIKNLTRNIEGVIPNESSIHHYAVEYSDDEYEIVKIDNLVQQHTVKFVDWDDTVLKTETVVHGASATAPANPSRVGYTFSGWDKAFTNVTSDLTIKARYDAQQCILKYINWDNFEIKTETANYDTEIVIQVKPTRDKYIFVGWNTKADGSGTAYVNGDKIKLNQQEINLYAQWKKQVISDPCEYSFTNSDRYFTKGKWVPSTKNPGYLSFYPQQPVLFKIDKEYLDLLKKNQENRYKGLIDGMVDRGWGGSCYGMSMVRDLVKRGEINVSDWQSGAKLLIDFNEPHRNPLPWDNDQEERINVNVQNLINYYHLSQMTKYAFSKKLEDVNNQLLSIEELVENMKLCKKENRFLRIGYYHTGKGGHAVLGSDIKEIDEIIDNIKFAYEITILDPNYNFKRYGNAFKKKLYISKDKTKWFYDTGDEDSEKSYVNDGEKYIYSDLYPEALVPNPIKILKGEDTTVNNISVNTDNRTRIIAKINDLQKIVNNDTGKVYDCSRLSDYNDISVMPLMDSIMLDGAPIEENFINLPDGANYSIIPKSKNKFIDISVMNKDSLSVINGKNTSEIAVSNNGDIAVKGNNATIDASITLNKEVQVLDKYKLEVKAEGVNDLSVATQKSAGATTGGGILIESNNLDNVKLFNSDDDSKVGVEFSTDKDKVLVTTPDSNELKVAIDENNTGTFDKEIKTVKLHTVTFKDWDDSVLKVDTVTHGAIAIAPANPTRAGYTFTGWDKKFDNVITDLIVNALYKKNGGGTVVIPPSIPTPTPTPQMEKPVVKADDFTMAYDGKPVTIKDIKVSGDVKGTWQFKEKKDIVNAGSYKMMLEFIPTDVNKYQKLEQEITITIKKAMPTGKPSFTLITTKGKTLADANLEVGSIKPIGKIKWDAEPTTIAEQGKSYAWVFTPKDMANYEVLKGGIVVYPTLDGDDKDGKQPKPDKPKPSKPADEDDKSNKDDGDDDSDDGNDDRDDSSSSKVVSKETTKKDENAVTEKSLYADLDVSDYYYSAIKRLSNANILKGTGDGKFSPNQVVNRAMLVTVLYRVAGEPAVKNASGFADVEQGSWYENPTAWAKANNIVNGYSESQFAPLDTLTREQIITVLYRYSKVKVTAEELAKLSQYGDANQISDYAKEAYAWAIAKGIVKANDAQLLDPKAEITRAELAVMVDKIMK